MTGGDSFCLCLLCLSVLPALHSTGLPQQQAPYVSWMWKESMCCSLMFAQECALRFFCRLFWMWILFLRPENHLHGYRAVCLLLYLFVVMTEVVGRMQVSGGVGAGSALSFPLAFVKSKASHVACFCFSGLCAAEAPQQPARRVRGLYCPTVTTGQGGCWTSFPQGPPGVALTSEGDKVGVRCVRSHGT